ncbi:sugar phosphate isomerase/epimerase family protein [Actomonas aquatica]|uniref:Sugar phosphate isomerase/epimerase n=1 Tax=Actomonas aquatica TaxID=2866162 RepID=A0ABZ1C312_9BACT|nr:sugar phosphate isomerase/epimerase [Opitutus sp. WL0086]WRQ85831.1 sugar phosphate isomerase/epimerase [Opitutus sp. WL0086]
MIIPCRRLFAVVAFVAVSLSSVAGPKLGLQTWTCRHMSFEEAVVFAAEHGITQLELFRAHLDPAAPREKLLEQKAFLEEHGVTAYSIGVSGTSMDKEENRQLFELAKLFGMKVIVVEPREPAQWDVLEELVREYDIKLAVHNHGTGTVYGNPATVKHVLAERDHRIGVCMDIGWVTAAGFDAEEVFRNYGDRVYDMHLKDKRLDMQDARNRPLDTFIGLGNANYAGLFAAIKETDWSGVLAIETDSAEFHADPTEFVRAAKTFFDAHFPDAE